MNLMEERLHHQSLAGMPTRPVFRRLLLAWGFTSLTIAILAAWMNPATGYEVSIYAATPITVWFGIAMAFGVSIIICYTDPRDRAAGIGLLLGGFTTVVVVSLPALRHYRYYGVADAMTHLGWAEEVRNGMLSPLDLLYPGGHVLTAVTGEVFGVSSMRAVLLVTIGLVGLYVLFIPLVTRTIVSDGAVVATAAFGGFFLLHINNVSTGLTFHAYSFALMGFPVILFILVKQLVVSAEPADRDRPGPAWLVILVLAACLTLFLHPQVMLNVVLLLGSFVGAHLIAQRYVRGHPIVSHRPGYGGFVLLTGIWLIWTIRHWQLQAAAENLIGSVVNTIMGEESPGQAAIDTGVSAAAIGASLTEFYLKLFAVSTVFAVASVLAVVGAVVAIHRTKRHSAHSVMTYFGCSGLILGPFFALHWLGDVSVYFFRHLGFAMVIATVVGAIGIQYAVARFEVSQRGSLVKTIGILLAVVALVLSLLIVFPSPYIYSATTHVTDQEVLGYQTTFTYSDETIRWSGIRTGPHRFHHGVTLEETPVTYGGASAYEAEELIYLLNGEFREDVYLPVSDRDQSREVIAYRELRFAAVDFDSLATSPQTNHVYTNGGFDLYFVQNTSATDGGTDASGP